jgi:hypothetical protein
VKKDKYAIDIANINTRNFKHPIKKLTKYIQINQNSKWKKIVKFKWFPKAY